MMIPGFRYAAYRCLELGFACAVAAGMTGCNPQPEHSPGAVASPLPSATEGVPPLKITGEGSATEPIRIIQEKANRRQYVLLARSYESRTAQGLAHATFYDATVTFNAPSGKQLTARAPRAIVDEATKTVMLVDGVAAHTSDGITLNCQTLTYHRNTGVLHGEGNVRMSNATGMHLMGSRFDSDVTLAKIRMQ